MKNKNQQTTGWLDNFNDSKVSLPSGFVGEGTFNGPQWDSPAWGGQFQLGGNVYPVNYVPQAQNGITSEDSMLNNIYSKWPALKKLGDVSIKADESFTRDKTGVGDIEFFSPNTPQVTYNNGYVAQNPGVDSYGILYNPSTNDEQNIRLDMLHGMAEADPRYRRLRNRFERAVGRTDIRDEMNHWYNIDREKGNAEDGREKWMDNYTDGQLRTLLFEGDRSKQNYSDEEANQLLSNPRVKRKFNKLNNYLQKEEFAMGGSLPGATGFMYARTGAPSNGPYAKKTKASAQNGMTFYQNGLDWKPKSISKNGNVVPQAQTGFEQATGIKPITSLTNSKESTSLGTKIDEAAIRQAQISRARENQGSIRKTEPKRSAVSKAMAIATNPMTALAYKMKGQDIPENFERGERNVLENAVDVINPVTYLNAAGRTVDNITSPKKMFYKTLNSIEGDDSMLGVVGDALMTAGIPGLAKSTLGTLDKQFSKVGQALEDIRYRGEAAGLRPYEIAKQQMQEVGITSNQRKAYTPILSNFAEKYIHPYGYQGRGGQSKLKEIIKNIKQGGLESKESAKEWEGSRLVGDERSDAWRLYLGKPQEYNTFRIAETAPVNHPSYSPEQLANMDIYSINSKYAKQNITPDINLFPEVTSPREIEEGMDLLRNKINIDKGNEIMGGYNRRLNQYGLEYNDIWDLQPSIVPRNYLPNALQNTIGESSLFIKTLPNGIQVPRSFKIDAGRFLGKPFMSHEVLPYTSSNLKNEMNAVLDAQLEKSRPWSELAPKVKKLEAYKEELKNYPKYKKGGVVKDNNGYWNPDNWGKVVEIDSPDITMKGVNQPLVGISDEGDVQYMEPEKDYKFKGKKVKEYPVGKNGVNQQDEKVDEQLDQLTNFTNYNKPTKGGWLDKYN